MTETGTEIATTEIGLERLQRRPIIDRIDQRQLALIKRTLAVAEGDQAITDAEIGHFLELCASYGLDPFAREAWIAKSKTGKLLIMVGRAGLRKIVMRNGHKMSSQVVHAKDTFMVEYVDGPDDARSPEEWAAWGCAPFHRVTHKSSGIGEAARGVIAGAWARVRDPKTGHELGFFTAPLSEYMPANASQYSPWSKQTSAMMRGAVERQAASEATPLGGLMVEGEDESANARETVGAGDTGQVAVELPGMVEEVIARGVQVGHERYGNRARVAMEIGGQGVEKVAEYVRTAAEELDQCVPLDGEITDADVVSDELADAGPVLNADALALRQDADELRAEAENLHPDDPRDAAEMLAEADALDQRADEMDGGAG